MGKTLFAAIAAASALCQAAWAADAAPSALWTQFCEQRKAGVQTFLPDFSYAGYRQGAAQMEAKGPVFNVKDYGAIPDDLKDDAEGISAAIKAASEAGGGIVFLPKGRYLVNTSMDRRGTIYIESSRVVLKGEGCNEGGTVIHSIHPYGGNFAPDDINRMHLGDNLFVIGARSEDKPLASREPLCRVVSDAPSQSFSVEVDDASKLKPGDMVCLFALNIDIMKAMIAPYSIAPEWTTITKGSAPTAELHSVKAIEGSRVSFAEPVHYDVKGKDGWTLKPFAPIREVGIEDICFMGSAHQRYIHHRSDMDDSGWAFIKMKGVAEGWVRRCSFVNASQTLCVSLSQNVSMLDIIVAGNPGHHIPRATYFDYGVLGGFILDRAGCTHGPSLSWGSIGTVYWRCSSPGAPDCHAGRPYVSLFDANSGGKLNPTGGLRDYPQHLRNLVLWNYEQQAKEPVEYDFWPAKGNNVCVKPIISGFHGSPARFKMEHVGVMESLGSPVSPESLYEAQLELRLGKTPEWLAAARRDFEEISSNPLPRHFEKDNPRPDDFLFIETFKAGEMLKYLTGLSLQPYNSKQFACKIDDPSLELRADQGMLRNAVYSLMYCVYTQNKEGNLASLARRLVDGKAEACFVIQPGRKIDLKKAEGNVDFKYAQVFAAKAGARIAVAEADGAPRFELSLPLANP